MTTAGGAGPPNGGRPQPLRGPTAAAVETDVFPSSHGPPPHRRRNCATTGDPFCLLVMLGVVLGGFVSVMGGVQAMGVRHMRVMSRLLVLTGIVVLGRLAVMVRGILVMLGRDLVMTAALVRLAAHVVLSSMRIEIHAGH